MLTWDVLVLNGYLLLNLHICGYLVYCAYRKRQPSKLFYIPFVFVAIVWAISIHTVTAFLYSGLGGRPFWNSAVVAPRFLASAFAAGPAFLILTLSVLATLHDLPGAPEGFMTLRNTVAIALSINMFLLGSEAFTEFYTDSAHGASAHYLFLGLHGRTRRWCRGSGARSRSTCRAGAPVPAGSAALPVLQAACVMLIVGIWIEKGMGMIVPGVRPHAAGRDRRVPARRSTRRW
jgi:hypothetical protein